MKQKVILIGAGGHAKVISDIIAANGDIVAGFYDDNLSKGTILHNAPVLGRVSDIYIAEQGMQYIIAIGNNAVRKNLAERFSYLPFYTAIHPCACLGFHVQVGAGSCVMPFAVLQADSVVGEHCILNTHSVLEHDSCLGNFVHLAPGSVLCGTVHIGEGCMIGAGAVVKNNITVAENCLIGAGATVVRNIISSGTYIGVPAKRMEGE